jgi:hypothetical protein
VAPACGRFADGLEVCRDGTKLHLASFCPAEAELHQAETETDGSAFVNLNVENTDVLGGAPGVMPRDHGMQLVLTTPSS